VTSCKVVSKDILYLYAVDWPLTELIIDDRRCKGPVPESLKPLLTPLVNKFPLLEKLTFDHCVSLRAFPANIGSFSRLKTLKMSESFCLEALPPSLSQLTALETLELGNCPGLYIEGLPPLKQLKQLKRFETAGLATDYHSFPEWVCNNITPALEELEVSGWTSFPSSIGNFTQLTSLVLRESGFSEISDSIGSLSMLQKLILHPDEEGDVALPASLSKLTALEELRLEGNTRNIFQIEHLTSLTRLHLDTFDEEMDEYPEFLWSFTLLKALRLTNGYTHRPPNAIGNLRNLEFLEFNNFINFEILPDAIGNLSSLTALHLRNCYVLDRLPESIGNLRALKELRIRILPLLDCIPESIGNLTSLESLEVSDCGSLTQLPDSFGNLKFLERLWIHGCSFTHFPGSIGKLNALKEFRLK
jgi:Leucine-rich repeat (LRR) protein